MKTIQSDKPNPVIPSDLAKAMRLCRELTGEIQRLEHREQATIDGWDATDMLTQLRSARDSAEEAFERLEEAS